MKKFTKFEIFELITILILFVALIADNSVVKEDNITYELSSTKEKKYIAKYIENEITGCNLTEAFNTLTDVTDNNNIYLSMYPVGSIYASVNSANPGTIFGGTWIEYGKGKTLVGVDTAQTEFDTVEETGGEKAHTLTVAEMPSHGNHLYTHSNNTLTGMGNAASKYLNIDTLNSYGTSARGWDAVASNEMYPAGQALGGNASHNNLQPYITVYMWKRTA